jgi:hypothetical protein
MPSHRSRFPPSDDRIRSRQKGGKRIEIEASDLTVCSERLGPLPLINPSFVASASMRCSPRRTLRGSAITGCCSSRVFMRCDTILCRANSNAEPLLASSIWAASRRRSSAAVAIVVSATTGANARGSPGGSSSEPPIGAIRRLLEAECSMRGVSGSTEPASASSMLPEPRDGAGSTRTRTSSPLRSQSAFEMGLPGLRSSRHPIPSFGPHLPRIQSLPDALTQGPAQAASDTARV